MSRGPRFSVRETTLFLIQLSAVYDLRRWDEIKRAFDLDVARNPYAFPAVPGTGLRAVGLNTIPTRTVYFWIHEDEDAIDLVGIL